MCGILVSIPLLFPAQLVSNCPLSGMTADPITQLPPYADILPPHVLRRPGGSPWLWLTPSAPPRLREKGDRYFSSSTKLGENTRPATHGPRLTHVSQEGDAHMVPISEKAVTSRRATAVCSVRFSNPVTLDLVRQSQLKKGDVLGVARVAGIMAAKRTADLIPLCHPIALSRVSVDLEVGEEEVAIRANVECDGKTGVEMEALMAASTAAMTVYDMCKAVDKGMVIEGLRVTLKEGGKSGRWEMG